MAKRDHFAAIGTMVAALLLVGCLDPAPGPTPTPDPSHEITRILAGHPEDAAHYRDYFEALADVVERDETIITTTGELRTLIVRSGTLLNQRTEIKGQYPELAKACELALEAAIGKQSTALDRTKRGKAVEAFRAIAAACGEAT